MQKIYLFVLLCCCFGNISLAQRLDIGLMAAGTHYYGDVVNEFEIKTIRYGAGGFIRYRLNNFMALKAFGAYATVSGDDKLSKSAWQKSRNWSFETLILEGSLQFEYNLLEDRNTARKLINKGIPYVFAGVGAFYFKPQSEVNNGMRLQSTAPLMLSGVKYQQIAVAIPFGVGYRYYVTRKLLVGFEAGLRYTTTSYIDDIGGSDKYVDPKTTPFPKAAAYYYNRTEGEKNVGDYRGKMDLGKFKVNDLYALFGVTVAYNFNKSKSGGSRIGKRQWCPRFY